MKRLIGQEVIAQKNNVQMSMTTGEAMLTAVIAKAMKGDLACVKFVNGELGLDLAQGAGTSPPFQITEADLACLETHAEWVGIVEAARNDLAEGKEDTFDDDGTD